MASTIKKPEEEAIIRKIYHATRMIDLRHRDQRYFEGSLHSLLWVLGLEEQFKKNLVPDTIIKRPTGNTITRKNYTRTMDKIMHEKIIE